MTVTAGAELKLFQRTTHNDLKVIGRLTYPTLKLHLIENGSIFERRLGYFHGLAC